MIMKKLAQHGESQPFQRNPEEPLWQATFTKAVTPQHLDDDVPFDTQPAASNEHLQPITVTSVV